MAQRKIIFDANSLVKLLCHYTQDHDDQIPIDAELVHAAVSPILQRWIAFTLRSNEWKAPTPLHIRYEGQKTMSWGGGKESPIVWKSSVDSPTS